MNSVGNLLKEQRESRGLTIDDVVNGTKIQKIYVDAIEKGDFSFFQNQEFYQQVFVGSYADFLGLNKNELLVNLQEDAKNYVVQPKEPVQATPQMDPGKVKKYLQDYDVKSMEVDPAVESVEVNNEIREEQTQPEVTNDEINQLIDEINQSVEVDLNEYFEPEVSNNTIEDNLNVNETSATDIEPLLNSSILEDIQKINDEAPSDNDELADVDMPTIHENPDNNFFNQTKDDKFDSTAVIDLTSGIEIETVSKEEDEPIFKPQATETKITDEIVDEPLIVEQPTQKETITNDRPSFSIEEITKQDDSILATLEKDLQSSNLNMEDPSKTSMDLKIAKALGDSKVAVDEKDEKKIKRDKVIDYLLAIIIIALVCYLGFLFWKQFI
ncbi:transcriptional regulator with XRE-family HTH domain [Bacilli bacterium PM5-3]|nr:transcriptional regulator with XRE-family HTH domain [Bacilli bacterium PM5-3]MDH6603810.1 transcriptional regulator with XRE-family HTH domain [Bacilli bacterium PM5-9]